jgi:DNA polymerase III sliding clamp (beta) subunit (PCNA family)
MKFSVEKKVLSPHLGFAYGAIGSKNTINALSNIKCTVKDKVLYIEAGDGIVSRFAKCEVHSSTNFNFCATGYALADFVRLSSGNIDFSVTDKRLNIKTSSGNHIVPTISADLYPSHTPCDVVKMFSIESTDLLDSIGDVEHMTASNPILPQSGAIHVAVGEHVEFAGMRSQGLAIKKTNAIINNTGRFVIPLYLIPSIRAVQGSVEFSVSDKTIEIRFGDRLIRSLGLEMNTPNYNRLVPSKSKIKVELEANALINSLRIIGVCASDNYVVALDVNKNSLSLHSEDVMLGIGSSETISAVSSDVANIKLSGKILTDAVMRYRDCDILIELDGHDKPMVIGSGSRLTTLIMPIS